MKIQVENLKFNAIMVAENFIPLVTSRRWNFKISIREKGIFVIEAWVHVEAKGLKRYSKIYIYIYIRPRWQIEPPNNLTEDFTK